MNGKPLEEMTEIERMRHWMDIVENGGGEFEAISESKDNSQITIVIRKKSED